ncbi:MAG: ABC transporter permease [Oscillospiraceae bacterium]|jgi:osmoprotectant transport system permease protein|nr:ABC transporter permease [Oscillospiraceae bacterium]
MTALILNYFRENSGRFWGMLAAHVQVSILSLGIAVLIGVPAGFLCVRWKKAQKYITGLFSVLRVIPSLAILLLMVPIMGTGTAPAVVALVLLAVPPILMNTVAGLEGVPPFMLETAEGVGMNPTQVWTKVRFPLAMPMILTGIKTAAVEIVASATLASKIGAGGLGDIIFAGIGLFKTELLLIGGMSVALLSLLTGLIFAIIEKSTMKHRTV